MKILMKSGNQLKTANQPSWQCEKKVASPINLTWRKYWKWRRNETEMKAKLIEAKKMKAKTAQWKLWPNERKYQASAKKYNMKMRKAIMTCNESEENDNINESQAKIVSANMKYWRSNINVKIEAENEEENYWNLAKSVVLMKTNESINILYEENDNQLMCNQWKWCGKIST